MKFTQILTAASALVATAAAGPIKKRAAYTDADILNYALTLEHLEDKFYRDGLAKFSLQDFKDAGYDKEVYNALKEVSYDETTHVSFLTSALAAAGAPAVAECTYAFSIPSVDAFLATASVLEGVGVTAYLGAAAKIASGAYLTAAASILTVESRHSAYLRSYTNGVPAPQAFDVPLDFNEVYTLAAPFIVSCPTSNPSFLPLAAFPSLTVSSDDDEIRTGSKITVDANVSGDVYAAFITVTGPVYAKMTKKNDGWTFIVPAGVHGQSYLVLTTSTTAATDDTIVAGPAIVEISGSDGMP